MDTTAPRTLAEQGQALAAALQALFTDYPTDAGDAPTVRITLTQHVVDAGVVELGAVEAMPGHLEWLTQVIEAEAMTARNAHPGELGECGHCAGSGRASGAGEAYDTDHDEQPG